MGAFVQVVKVLAIFTNYSVYLSPVPSTIRMAKTKNTGEVSILPLASLTGNSCIWVTYAILMSSFFPLFATSLFGLLSSIFYVAVYYYCTTERAYVMKVLCAFLIGVLLIIAYVVFAVTGITGQSIDQVGTIMGFAGVTFNLILFASPLETVRKVVRMKSASSLPIALCATSLVNCILWVIIGIHDDDMFVLTANVAGTMLGAIQVILYIMYNPNKQRYRHLAFESGNLSQLKEDLVIAVVPEEDVELTDDTVVYEALQYPRAPIDS